MNLAWLSESTPQSGVKSKALARGPLNVNIGLMEQLRRGIIIDMKSAYELAMEKLQKESPDQSLSDEKKAELAELDNLYKSKLAEREVFLGGKIAEAEASGDLEALEQLQRELTSDKKTLESELEEKKEEVRSR